MITKYDMQIYHKMQREEMSEIVLFCKYLFLSSFFFTYIEQQTRARDALCFLFHLRII